MCTIEDDRTAVVFDDEDLVMTYVVVDSDDEESNNTSINPFCLCDYSHGCKSNYLYEPKYLCVQQELDQRVAPLLSQHNGKINKMWILLDSQSTVDFFCNKELITNIRIVSQRLVIHCNTGRAKMNLMGDLPGYGPVWYYKDGMANIPSMYLVSELFHVQYDNRTSNDFVV